MVHLLPTRGDKPYCGGDGETQSDIQKVTCLSCISKHDDGYSEDSPREKALEMMRSLSEEDRRWVDHSTWLDDQLDQLDDQEDRLDAAAAVERLTAGMKDEGQKMEGE